MKLRSSYLAATALATACAVTSAAAQAQEGGAASSSASSAAPSGPAASSGVNSSGDIIVTARKRAESVLKVPVVISVLDAPALRKSEITDIRALTQHVPGLIIGSSVGTVGPQISLRGIGTSALDAGIDQSVSLNIDGQQFSQGYAFTAGLFDLAQAETLKGPQALFFGKNSPGGVISLTTADPGDALEIIGTTSYEFEAREKRAELIVSGPVTDTLGLRLAGSWSDSDGYFHNTAVATPGLGGLDPKHRRYGGVDSYIIRGTSVWKPTSNFRARLKVNFTRDHGAPQELQFVSCPNGSDAGFAGIKFIGGCKQDRNYELVDLDPTAFQGTFSDGSDAIRDGVPFETIVQRFGVLEMDFRAPTFTITSTSTYYHNSTVALINGTMSGAAGPALSAANKFRRQDVTQEIRAESDTNSSLNWLLGGYFQDADMFNDIDVAGNQAALGAFFAPFGIPGAAFTTLTAGAHDVSIRSELMFGQLRWKPIPQVELAAGARWTHETRSDAATSLDTLTGVYNNVPLVTPKLSSSNWAPEATITYTPSDTLTIFGAYKTGFKSGSYSITTPATPGLDNSFGDEKVRGGEIGLKTRTEDHALTANVAFYYYKYKGLQVGVSQTSNTNVPVLRTLNAGAARTYGVDLDATYRPPSIPNLSFTIAANWNKAKYLELDGVPCYGGQTIALGCNEAFDPSTGLYTGFSASGEPLEHAPEWQINGGVDYEVPIGSNLRLAFGASAQYSSRYKTVIGPREDYYQGSYTKLNGYVTLKDSNDRWELSLIGNNINDVLRAGYCANSNGQDTVVLGRFTQVTGGATNPTGKIDDVECGVDPGRQIFLRLTVRPVGLFH